MELTYCQDNSKGHVLRKGGTSIAKTAVKLDARRRAVKEQIRNNMAQDNIGRATKVTS